MADDHTQQPNQSPWMKPPEPVRRTRTQRMGDRYAGQYTPNEPDSNEAVYAAQAAAARQRAQTLRTEALTRMAAVQDAPEESGVSVPDAVLYRHNTGIPTPEEQPAATSPAQPDGQPRRRRRRATPPPAEEAAPVTDDNIPPLYPADSGLTDTARTRAQAIQAAREALEQQDTSLRRKAEIAKIDAREEQANTYAPAQGGQKPVSGRGSDIPPDSDALLLVSSSTTPFGLPEGVVWEPPRAQKAAAEDEDDAAAEDQMETGRMPSPAPVSTLDVPKTRKANRLLTLLAVVMLLIAAGAFLWLSGLGESLWQSATGLYTELTSDTIKTGEMSVVPEAAAVPTVLTVTLATDNTIAGLRLLDDNGNVLEAAVLCTANGEDCLWSCRVVIEKPYSGFIRAQLLNKNGEWILGSSSRYVSIN